MGTVVDTGDEKEEEAVVIRDSPVRLPLVFATGVEKEMEKEEAARLNSAPGIVGCPRPRSPRSRSPRLAALVHKLHTNLDHQRRELDICKRDLNDLYLYNNP